MDKLLWILSNANHRKVNLKLWLFLNTYHPNPVSAPVNRKTSAELKLVEVDRQRRALETEEKNFLLEKERSQKKLEVEKLTFKFLIPYPCIYILLNVHQYNILII